MIEPRHVPPEIIGVRRRAPIWPYALAAAFLAIGLLIALLWPVKVPYFAMSPGPVEQVPDLVSIEGAEVYGIDGAVYLLTVGIREVNPFEWLEARFFEPQVDLIERELLRPPGVTREQVTRSNLEAMNQSIDTAVFVALAHVGYEVGFTGTGVQVFQVVEGSPADGALEVGDVITHVAGVAVITHDQAAERIRSFEIGDTIRLVGMRGDEPLDVEITLAPHPEIDGAPMVGVALDTMDLEMVLPFEVRIDSRNIGGPSAGLMYALTLVDLLTEEDLMKGYRVAGTGTIRFDETVGPVGGVRQKVFGARAIGIDIVFVPQDNYQEALSAAGDGITIVPVETLQDALDFLETLTPKVERVAAGV